MSHSFLCFAQRYVIGLVVVLDKLTPQGFLGQGVCGFTASIYFLLRHRREIGHRILDGISHLGIVIVGAMDDLNTIHNLAIATAKLAP